jgi:hypothetical protein
VNPGLIRLGVLAALAASALGVPAALGAAQHADGASADSVAIFWVRALQRGDVPKACGVSVRVAPEGRGCRGLTPIVYSCPEQGPGHPRPHIPARTPEEQVDRVTIHGDRATALLVAEARSRTTHARLTLRLIGDQWLAAAVHRRGHAFDFMRVGQGTPPAPSAADGSLYSKLFLNSCVKPVFG